LKEEFEDTKGVIRIVYRRRTDNTKVQKEKGQKDKQRSTNITHKTKDRGNTNPTKNRE
jgi:hypothetical protein